MLCDKDKSSFQVLEKFLQIWVWRFVIKENRNSQWDILSVLFYMIFKKQVSKKFDIFVDTLAN